MAFSPINKPDGKKNGPFRFSLWWMYAIVFLFLAGIYIFDTNIVAKKVSYSDFVQYVERDHGISKIIIFSDKRQAEGLLTDSLASVIFKNHSFHPEDGVVAKVEVNISSADQLSEKIDEWRQAGAVPGDGEYEQ
ncbi:MAG: hypothetical protein K2I39_04385, partial [Muribaculaceae bacterium]|nr:hypothetical protein [Muribaculaceae bacterium]